MKYFLSVAVLLLAQLTLQAQNKRMTLPAGWQEFSHEEGAFSIYVPSEMEYEETLTPAENEGAQGPFKMQIYTCMDFGTGNLYMLRYNNAAKGIVFNNDSLTAAYTIDDLAMRYGTEAEYVREIELDGFPGWEIKHSIQGLDVWFRVYLRGNRMYLLAVQELTPKDGSYEAMRYLNSFRLQPTSIVPLKDLQTDTANYHVLWPDEPALSTDTIGSWLAPEYWTSESAVGLDELTGDVFLIEHYRMNPYARLFSLDSLMDDWQASYTEDNLELLESKDITVDGLPGREWLFSTRNRGANDRVRMIVRGTDIYMVHFSGSKDAPQQEKGKQFLESFHFRGEAPADDLFSPKLEKIVAAIQGEDTVQANLADQAMRGAYEVKEDEYELLKKLVVQPIEDDTAFYGSTRSALISGLRAMPFEQVDPICEELYKSCWEFPHLQTATLQMLAAFDTVPAFENLITLLHTEVPIMDYYQAGWLFRPHEWVAVEDAKRFVRIAPFLGNETLRGGVLRTAANMLELDTVPNDFIRASQDSIFAIRDAFYEYASIYSVDSLTMHEYYVNPPLLRTLLYLDHTPQTKQYYQLVANQQSNNYQQILAMIGLAVTGEEIPKKLCKTALKPQWNNMDLFRGLEKHNKLDAIPSKYLSQKSVAADAVFEFMASEEVPEKVKITASRQVTWKGEPCVVYIAKADYVWYNYETGKNYPESYMAFAGPFPLDSSEPAVPSELVGSLFEIYNAAAIDSSLELFIEAAKEEQETEE